MKTTKRQLKRIIREMHPRAGVDNAIADYLDFVEAKGHITPAASSVIASYFVSKGNWDASHMRMLGDHYGIPVEDIQREASIQRKEMAAAGGLQYGTMPAIQGPRTRGASPPRGMPDGRLGRLGESKMKITKRQLRRIIKEEKARLLAEQPGRPMPKAVEVERDALLVVDQLQYAFFDALEELGVDAETAEGIEHYLKRHAELDTALENGLHDYKKKLNMMGGIPKPRSI